MKEVVIVGIAGGTASGKTTLANKLKRILKDDAVILSHDFYYKSLTHLTKAEREQRNYDCPEAFETDLLINDLKKLISGQTIERPIYSYIERLREKETVTVNPVPVIILEGLMVLENKKLLDLMDLKIYVDTEDDVRLIRLLERDTKKRGLTVEYIIKKYKTTLKPMHKKYIEPCKKKADLIVKGNVYRKKNVYSIIQIIEDIRKNKKQHH